MEHPKLLGAGPVGVTLWLAGLCYCNRQRRDGFIPALKVPCLYPMPGVQRAAAKLVEVGLWEQVEGGFRIHDYHDYQPDAERSDAVSAARAEAGRIGGLKSAAARKSASEAGVTKQTASKPEATCLKQTKQMLEARLNPVPIPIPRSEKRIAASSVPADPLPLVLETSGKESLSREKALGLIEEASLGRFLSTPPGKGGAIKLDRLRKAHPDGAIFTRIGRWLASGGDAWKGRLDGRAIGNDLDAWVAQASSWDGASKVDGGGKSTPQRRMQPSRDDDDGVPSYEETQRMLAEKRERAKDAIPCPPEIAAQTRAALNKIAPRRA